ncbi:PREDICTED: calponin-1, partial [Nipponia nippon]|uniref:calponin-1 n=1 Tax=Nipponia nippon TaxID=128390 RepID=UPI000510E419
IVVPGTALQVQVEVQGAPGRRIGDSFMDGLKDGVILCELINKLQPGSVQKVNEPVQNWHKLENIGNFLRAITRYGVKPHDIFEANDLFENTNHTQVQSTLIALASQAKTKGNNVGLGVKYAEKQQRRFHPEKLREGRNIIGLQTPHVPACPHRTRTSLRILVPLIVALPVTRTRSPGPAPQERLLEGGPAEARRLRARPPALCPCSSLASGN